MDESQKRTARDNPSSIVYERKFDVPLRNTFYKKYLESLELNKRLIKQNDAGHTSMRYRKQLFNRYDRYIQDTIDKLEISSQISHEPTHYPAFLEEILKYPQDLNSGRNTNRKYRRLQELVNENIKIQANFSVQNNFIGTGRLTRTKFANLSENTDLDKTISNLLFVSQELSKIIDRSNQMFSPEFLNSDIDKYPQKAERLCQYTIPSLDTQFWWSESLCYIRVKSQLFCAPRVIILLFHNKICDLISVLTLAKFSEGISLPNNASEFTLTFIRELIRLSKLYKNKFFEIMKVLEGLVISETLIEVEEWLNSSFLHNITDDLYEKSKFMYIGSFLQGMLLDADIPFRHELGCLSKILGHPYVDMEAGAKTLHKKVTEELPVNLFRIHDCINHMKRDYIRKHIQRHKRWPPCHFSTTFVHPGLREANLRNKDPESNYITKKHGVPNILDYQFIELDQNYEFQELENIIPYLKDKTISLMRDKVIQKYFENRPVEETWKDTRVLLTYLLNPSSVHNHTSYLHQYTTVDSLDQLMNYLVIRIVPKEKELKIDFRGFGCRTFEDRHRSTVQEKNVSLYLGEYSDEQTVTLSELEILKKLDAFRRIKKAYTRHIALYIVIDASAWNNRFSRRTVDDMMHPTLCKLFNNRIFARTHESFEHTLFYVNDGSETYHWDGQRGGIEGQNQYTWMTCYINQMRVAMQNFPFRYHILCKGDDMRIVVLVPQDQYDNNMMSNLKTNIVTHISETCKEFGHKINIDESYASCRYFAFSKSASIDNIELPQSYRKIQKTYGANNAFINTLDDYIASTFSNAHSACKVSVNIMPNYRVALFWSYWYLLSHDQYGKLTNDQLTGLLLLPSLLGGFPIIYLHNCYVRAESDLLSPCIALYTFCIRHYPGVAQVMESFFYIHLMIPDSLIQLFMDPYSIPITRPPLPSSVLRSLLVPQLKRVCQNNVIKELIKATESEDHKIIIDALNSATIIRAKVLSCLYNSTPQALLDQFLRKFESGKSVLDFLLIKRSRVKVNRTLRLVLRAEIKLQQWRLDHLRLRPHKDSKSIIPYITECPAQSAFNIRRAAFGKAVYDITMPPLQHQMVWMLPAMGLQQEWCQTHHFRYSTTLGSNSITHDKRLHYATGPYTPFMGYTTRTGNVAPTLHFVEKDPSLLKMKTLLETCEWANISSVDQNGDLVESNILDLVKKLLSTYTDVDITLIAPFCGKKKSGTSQHHMRSPAFRESIVPNTLSNVYTMIKGETNTHLALRHSREHYMINLLHCYCYAVWMAFIELDVSPTANPPSIFWGVTTDCLYCNEPIREEAIRFSPGLINAIYLSPLNAVALTDISISILTKSLHTAEGLRPNIREENDDVDYRSACMGIMQQVITIRYINRRNIITRTGGHIGTQEGLGVLATLTGGDDPLIVGLTELKRLDIEIISIFLTQTVRNFFLIAFPTEDVIQIRTWLLYSPTEAMPWTSILAWINEGCRLPELIRHYERTAHVSAGGKDYSVNHSARYIGQCVLAGDWDVLPLQHIVIMNHYEPAHLETFIKYAVQNLAIQNAHLACPYIECIRAIQNPHINDLSPVLGLIMRGILAFHYTIKDDERYATIADDLIHNERLAMAEIYEYEDIDEFLLEEILINELSEGNTIYRPIRKLIVLLHKCYTLRFHNDIPGMVHDFIRTQYQQAMVHYEANPDYIIRSISTIYTSLPSCISVVREHNRDNDDIIVEFLEENHPIHRFLPVEDHQNHYGLIRRPLLRQSSKLRQIEGYDRAVRIQIPDITELDQNIMLHPGLFTGSYGIGNSSATIAYELLHSFGVFKDPLQTYKTALALNDGIGGYSLCLDLELNDSQIIFHTHPDEDVFNPEPIAIREARNQLVYRYLQRGLYNLESMVFIRWITSNYPSINIITSDLEHPYPLSDEYQKIQLNILRLACLNEVHQMFLSQKIDLRAKDAAASLLMLHSMIFENTFLCIPRSQTHEQFAYLVSFVKRGFIRQLAEINLLESLPVADMNSAHMLANFIRKRNLDIARYLGRIYTLPLTIRVPALIVPRNRSRSYGLLGINRLIRECEITNLGGENDVLNIIAGELGQVTTRYPLSRLLHFKGLNIISLINRLETLLRDPGRSADISNFWRADTRTHRINTLRTIFKLRGVYDIFGLINGEFIGGLYLDIGRVRQLFRTHIVAWDNGRDIVPDPNFNLVAPHAHNCLELEFWKSYNYGIKIAIQTLMNVIYSHDNLHQYVNAEDIQTARREYDENRV